MGLDRVLRGSEVKGVSVGLPNAQGVVLIQDSDGTSFMIENVARVEITSMVVSGRGSIGIVI